MHLSGALDLFTGNFGVAKELCKTNCLGSSLTFEIARSASEDLLSLDLQRKLLKLLHMGLCIGRNGPGLHVFFQSRDSTSAQCRTSEASQNSPL